MNTLLTTLLLLQIASFTSLFSMETLKQLQLPDKTSGLALFSTADLKKKQLQKLEDDFTSFKKTAAEALANCNQKSAQLNILIEEVREMQENYSGEAAAIVNKKINVLTERKQYLTNMQELIKEIEDSKEKHVKLLSDVVEFHQNYKKSETRGLYSWQELRDAQMLTAELVGKIEAERKKKEDLLKQKNVELETIASLQKRIEVKNKEQRKTASEYQASRPSSRASLIQLENELYGYDVALTQEKIEFAHYKVQLLEAEISLKDDELDYFENQLSAKKALLVSMEKRLSLTTHDVELVKAEANLEAHKAVRVKEVFAKKIESKKFEKEKLVIERNLLKNKLKTIESQSKPDFRSYHFVQSELNKITQHIHTVEREIDLLTAKSSLAEIPAQNKELVAHEVDIRYKMHYGSEDIAELITTFKNQRDIALNELKKQKDKRDEVMVSFVENSRENDEIKAKQEKIVARRDSLFGGNIDIFTRIMANLEESKRFLSESLSLNQDFLAVSAELLSKQEKIIGQYDLILEHLEAKKIALGLWKRSPKALAFHDFTRAIAELEGFFWQLSQAIIASLAPAAIMSSLSDVTPTSLFNFVVWALLLAFLIFLIKLLCAFALRRLQEFSLQQTSEIGVLSLTIGRQLFIFISQHFLPLMVWFSLYIHTVLGPRWFFQLPAWMTSPATLACIYLASIPFLLYFSTKFLAELKELNRRLKFLFFTEKFQDRFIFLIASFFYASATLLPLRLSIIAFFSTQYLVVSDVLLAAYSLILIIIALLFFNKEDVVRLIPDQNFALRWLKAQVDAYYYPTFFFVMLLFILSNQYIGYFNLAGYLAFAVPATILGVYGILVAHFYIRKYAIFLFMKETDDEIADKFEYAKTYYGFFVIFSFLLLLMLGSIIVARMWGYHLSPQDLWKWLSESFVVPIGVDRKFGFVQLMSLVLFIVGGFFASSLITRFVLSKLFDILKTEPGTQNTVTKIFHYLVISMSIILGFVAIHLEQFIWYIGTLVAVGLGFALKDILTDYVAGFFVLIERPIEIGNFIRLDNNPELQGTVHKIDARSTTVMTKLNHSLIISNKELITKTISNWGKGRFAVGFEVSVAVDYRSNVDEVKTAILEVIQSNPVILRVPNIIVRLEDFDDTALNFLARAFISSRRVAEQWNIAAALREEIFKAFGQRGIQFGFPHRVIHFGDYDGQKAHGPITFNFDKN